MVVARIVGTAWLNWRARVSPRQTALACLPLAVLIVFTGQGEMLLGLGLILLVVMLMQEFGHTKAAQRRPSQLAA